MRRLVDREPGGPLGVVGVSLGGNVVVKWLGELGADAPAEVRGAVGISVPFDLVACARALDRGLNRRLYTANFLRTMRAKVLAKSRIHPGFVDVAAAARARTFAEYDRVVTAPLGGFAELDYWTRASSGPYLDRVRRPALLIGSRDDPMIPAASLPDFAGLGSTWLTAEISVAGGHVGFVAGSPWRPVFWAEARAVDFLGRVAFA